ncbi:hypothetical protein [Allomuricauda sp. R78024]|uniref:hypothetical protein n=1 Tax=Allomuricauda sp. R78024 TaxID=3093867 RepID=UPI0037C7B6D5
MSNLKSLLMLMGIGILLVSCKGDTDDDNPIVLDAGTLSGGPFTFTVDGIADMVSGITLDANDLVGSNTGYVITDESGNILGLPPTLEAVEGVNFDEAGAGVCLIWHIVYEDGLQGLEAGLNTSGLAGDYDLSNSLTVTRNGLNAGMLSGGPYNFVVDGIPDMVSTVALDDSMLTGDAQTYVITDDSKNILGIPPTLEAVMGVDFDGAGVGSCYIFHLTYSGELSGLEGGQNLNDLSGNFALSNFVVVNRDPLNAGTLSGGPYNFVVDGTPDMVSAIALDDSGITGDAQTYVITDDSKNILGIPPTLEAVKGVDFDGAGVGSCYIFHLSYSGELAGLEGGQNLNDMTGNFALSNFVTVNRNALNAGTLSGGPYNFVVDGTPDMVSAIALDDLEVNGAVQTYVITDDSKNILGVPPTLDAVKGVDFDGAGVGSCYIFHLTYSGELSGLEGGQNLNDLSGNFALSNFVTVNRNALNAGYIGGGPFLFKVDGTPDMVSGIYLDDSNLTGSKQGWVITDEYNNILGLPPTIDAVEGVDFDAAGVGICFIWHITYEEGLTGLEAGMNVADLDGFYDLSNSIKVTRELPH